VEDKLAKIKVSTKQVVMIQRQGVFIIVVGTNGTGKTTFVTKLIDDIGRRVLIVDPDGLEWQTVASITSDKVSKIKKGKRARIIAPTPEDLVQLINFSDGSLVLDDCRYYIRSRIAEPIRQVLVRRRQRAIDVFAVAHSLNEVPPVFWTFATHLILFKTTDNPERLKHNLPHFEDKIKTHLSRVNENKDHHYFEIVPLR